MATLIKAATADPLPRSEDGAFDAWADAGPEPPEGLSDEGLVG